MYSSIRFWLRISSASMLAFRSRNVLLSFCRYSIVSCHYQLNFNTENLTEKSWSWWEILFCVKIENSRYSYETLTCNARFLLAVFEVFILLVSGEPPHAIRANHSTWFLFWMQCLCWHGVSRAKQSSNESLESPHDAARPTSPVL
jgi:hypothetical protein